MGMSIDDFKYIVRIWLLAQIFLVPFVIIDKRFLLISCALLVLWVIGFWGLKLIGV